MPDDHLPRPQEPELHRFDRADDVPNNAELPLLVYRGVLDTRGPDPAGRCEALFARNRWKGAWRNGVYDYHHYHTTTHEVLGIVRGHANVRFGGRNGRSIVLRAGDVVVIPAGVGHKNEGASPDLLVVGAYPAGQDWDICPARAGEPPCAQSDIARVPRPVADPVYGLQGPLMTHWRAPVAAHPG